MTLPPQLLGKIQIQPAPVNTVVGPCWDWKGARFHKRGGYGAVGYAGKTWRVHRLTYTLLVGPIPSGLEIDHLCRNRTCCNPEHLEPVTRAVNLERAPNGRRKSHCIHGHALVGDNLFQRRRGHLVIWECRTCIRAAKRRSRASTRKAQLVGA